MARSSLQIAYVWHASVFTREVLNGLLRIGFLYPQQIIWNKGRTVLTHWYQHEPCWYVRKKNAPWFGKAGENSTVWDSASPKFIMGGSDEEKFDHPTQKPIDLMRRPILNHTKRDSRRGGTHGARLLRHRTGSGVCRRNRDALAIPEQQEGHARRRRTDVLGDQPGTEGGSLNSLLLVSNCITQSTFVWGGTGRRRPSSTRMEPPFGYRRSENRLWPAGAAWVR